MRVVRWFKTLVPFCFRRWVCFRRWFCFRRRVRFHRRVRFQELSIAKFSESAVDSMRKQKDEELEVGAGEYPGVPWSTMGGPFRARLPGSTWECPKSASSVHSGAHAHPPPASLACIVRTCIARTHRCISWIGWIVASVASVHRFICSSGNRMVASVELMHRFHCCIGCMVASAHLLQR